LLTLVWRRLCKYSAASVGPNPRHRSLFHLGRQFPIGRSPAQFVNYHPVPFPPQLAQQSPHLPFRDADLFGCLLLRDQFLLGLPSRPFRFPQGSDTLPLRGNESRSVVVHGPAKRFET